MEINTPKNVAQVINMMKNLDYTAVLLSDHFAFCFRESEFFRLNEFISTYDNVTDKQGKDPLFCTFFFVAYDNEDKNSCLAVADEVKLMRFLSDAEFECIIIPAPNVLKFFNKGWSIPFGELVDYKDN